MTPVSPAGPNEARRVRQVRRILGVVAGEQYDAQAQAAVERFQRAEGLVADRVVGPKTWLALVRHAHRLGVDADVFERVPLVSVELPGITQDSDVRGYRATTLRADVAAAMSLVVDEVWSLGGLVTSAGGVRPLGDAVKPGRVVASGHYLGRDHDLALGSGMRSPLTDACIVTRAPDLGERRWRVWARVIAPVGTLALDAVVWGRNDPVRVLGRFVDLTAIMARHGFRGIPARRGSWWEAGHVAPREGYSGAEWWHWSHRQGLDAGVTTYGDELLRVHHLDALEGTAPWAERDRVYGVRGDGGWR